MHEPVVDDNAVSIFESVLFSTESAWPDFLQSVSAQFLHQLLLLDARACCTYAEVEKVQ